MFSTSYAGQSYGVIKILFIQFDIGEGMNDIQETCK